MTPPPTPSQLGLLMTQHCDLGSGWKISLIGPSVVEMSNDRPPPYQPTAPGPPPVLSSQPGAFPGSSYQTFPQTYAGGGDHAYYQHPGQLGHSGHSGYPGHLGHPGHLIPQPGYHSTPYPPKHTVYIVERQQDHHEDGNSGSDDSCLSALSTALCCCCLFDLLSHHDF